MRYQPKRQSTWLLANQLRLYMKPFAVLWMTLGLKDSNAAMEDMPSHSPSGLMLDSYSRRPENLNNENNCLGVRQQDSSKKPYDNLFFIS